MRLGNNVIINIYCVGQPKMAFHILKFLERKMKTMGVRFISVGLKSTYLALENKDSSTLYWIIETSELFKGEQLFGTGALATEQAAGLLSPEDYIKLRSIAGLDKLTAVDGTIFIADAVDGGMNIGVSISKQEGNQLQAVEGGLFVPAVVVPEYSIEQQETAEDGFSASYRLKKTVGEEVSYVGDTINIAKNLVLQSATLETVTEDGVPYADAKVGDPYIKMVFNNADASNLYIPVKGLVDTYIAGSGIIIENGVVSVKLADITHGLVAVDGALSIDLATRNTDGAMSKEDKKFIDSIPHAYVTRKYDISGTPDGTLVDYRDHEIRIMCPADAEFKKQEVGAGGDANAYYMTFNTFAPNNAVGYIEHIGDKSDTEILTKLSVDEYGRKYQTTWLGIASYDEATDTWSYYGANSSVEKYIGWDYKIDWYDADNKVIATDSVRINLSNESCHNELRPYYGPSDLSADVKSMQNDIAEIKEVYTWAEL
jgi:hypothetical protein